MHVCLFDIDGTLLNSGGAGLAALEEAIETVLVGAKPMAGLQTAGRTDRAITSDLFDYYEVEDSPETRERFIAAYLSRLEGQLAEREGMVLPGIVRLLELLAARDDVLLGLLTGNFQRGARMKLEHYDLHHHFEFGGFGDHHEDRDDVAREAMKALDSHHSESVELSRVWVIGDTPADVRCARAVGANAAAVTTGIYGEDDLKATNPDLLFSDFSDPDLLLSLLK